MNEGGTSTQQGCCVYPNGLQPFPDLNLSLSRSLSLSLSQLVWLHSSRLKPNIEHQCNFCESATKEDIITVYLNVHVSHGVVCLYSSKLTQGGISLTRSIEVCQYVDSIMV